MNQLDISIIVPVFNEEDSINELYDELSSSIPPDLNYEIIFINDGSQDDSSKQIKSIILKDNKVKLIDFFINGGKSEALNLGFRKSLGDIILLSRGGGCIFAYLAGRGGESLC